MAPATQELAHTRDTGFGLTLLGSEYEKKKQKLIQELKLDYHSYIAKKKEQSTREPHWQQQIPYLPAEKRELLKERLVEERKKEYNLLLQEQTQNKRTTRGTPPITSETNSPSQNKESHSPFRRDVATLTRAEDEDRCSGSRNRCPRRRKRFKDHRQKKPPGSEEELSMDEKVPDFRISRRHDAYTEESEYKNKRRTREHRANRTSPTLKDTKTLHYGSQRSSNSNWNMDKQLRDIYTRTAERATSGHKKDRDSATGLMIGASEEQAIIRMKKEKYGQELLQQIAEQRRNKINEKKLELNISAMSDPEKKPARMQQYEASYHQHKNQRSDSKTGRKESETVVNSHHGNAGRDSLMGFGPSLNQFPADASPAPRMGVAPGVSPSDHSYEAYTGNLSRMRDPAGLPMLSAVTPAPPAPPVITNMHQPPNDGGCYHYGVRSQELYHLQNQNDALWGPQQARNLGISPETQPHIRENEKCLLDLKRLHVDNPKHQRESAVSYQEQLKQQIKQNEEIKRREKEQMEHNDAKIKAEMVSYNYWGRSGGGAPIIDQNGKLVSNLYQMRKMNNDITNTPKDEATIPSCLPGSSNPLPSQTFQHRLQEELIQQMEEKKRKQAEERERKRIQSEKDEERLEKERALLKQQYEEEQRRHRDTAKKDKYIPQREEESSPTEKEKMVATSKMEQNNSQLISERAPSPPIPALQKKLMRSATSRPLAVENQDSPRTREPSPPVPNLQKKLMKSATSRPLAAENQDSSRTREPSPPVPALQKKLLKSATSRPLAVENQNPPSTRQPSPPVPALQKKLTTLRPLAVENQDSPRTREPSACIPSQKKPTYVTENSVSAPQNQSVPERMTTLHSEQQDVIKELSALRHLLKKEQRRIKHQLGDPRSHHSHLSSRHRFNVFESAKKESPFPWDERNML